MKEVKKVSAALKAVERWDEYLLRRAVGINFIVWAAVIAVGGFITLKAGPIANAIGVSKEVLIAFTWLVAVAIAVPIIAYFFASAGKALVQAKVTRRRGRLMGIVLGVVWFACILGARRGGDFIGHATAWPLYIGIANVLSYTITKATGRGYTEPLVIGTPLLAMSPAIYILGTGDVASLVGLTAIVLAYCAGGLYSLVAAARALVKE